MKKIAFGLIALLCLACLVVPAMAYQNVSPMDQFRNISQKSPLNNITASKSFPRAQTISASDLMARYAQNEQPPDMIHGTPYCYKKSEIDPAPYINATLPEKRNLWFHFNLNYWWVDWDREAKKFDTIVIHDGGYPNLSVNENLVQLETVFKKNLYERRYNSGDNDPYVKGLPPHSGHLYNGRETFLPFHVIIFPDGTVVRPLKALEYKNDGWYVDEVAWHAGDWDVNCRSISICIVGNFESGGMPTDAQMKAVKAEIKRLKQFNSKAKVTPHYQYNSQINCPGFEFFNKLLKYINS
jgi:hypothetical protein